jgi:Arc/MetJ-type ribon-helix-helix transcriptional regulator
MTIQITVRLPDEEVAYIDELVQDGEASSRAAVVAAALKRDRRRRDAERDLAIIIATSRDPDPDDLDALTAHASRTELTDLD